MFEDLTTLPETDSYAAYPWEKIIIHTLFNPLVTREDQDTRFTEFPKYQN